MADFNIALSELLKDEGVFSNNPVDSGGETVYGISRKFNPNWLGWQRIDELVKLHPNLVDLNRAIENDPDLSTATASFYRQKYWNFDKLSSQTVANRLLSMEVNFGSGTAVRILQQGLNRLGHNVAVDGSLGAQTLGIVADENEANIMHMLRAYAALYRLHRVLASPDQLAFAEGWLLRDTA